MSQPLKSGLRRTWTARCACGREATVDAGRYGALDCVVVDALHAAHWSQDGRVWKCPMCALPLEAI